MNKLTTKPSEPSQIDSVGRYQKFDLKENPFPPEPTVNKESDDKRVNGEIYEFEIRRIEYEQLERFFLKQQLSKPVHTRLGYIVDSSYIGRGNGKSAFLINLQHKINDQFGLDISGGINKCFAVYVQPEPGGRTKTFMNFLDAIFRGILRSKLINISLATLRLEAIATLHPGRQLALDDETLVEVLNSGKWFEEERLDVYQIDECVIKNQLLQDLPSDFPLFRGRNSFFQSLVTQDDFMQYYSEVIKKGGDRLDFLFSHLVRLFQAASFNGAFILVDDFERIPDWQSARQKRDFALELRTAVFDGLSLNAKLGFYNFILVLHAGVPALISNAWAESGMENRAPISPSTSSNHLIRFEKLNKDHAVLMIKKYLAEYRLGGSGVDPLYPFTHGAVVQIGELSEYNAAKILKMCYDLLEISAESQDQRPIDESFIAANRAVLEEAANKSFPRIENADSVDLQKKAGGVDN